MQAVWSETINPFFQCRASGSIMCILSTHIYGILLYSQNREPVDRYSSSSLNPGTALPKPTKKPKKSTPKQLEKNYLL